MRRKIVIANWKMHGTLALNAQLFASLRQQLQSISQVDFVICVPHPYLFQAQTALSDSNIAWGAQNVAKFAPGPHTGEVSLTMLQDFATRFVMVGHSERSLAYCESPENNAEKFVAIKQAGLTPILCMGETLQEREAGIMNQVISERLDAVLKISDAKIFANSIIAYEPVWAIGTGLSASPQQAQDMHHFIRKKIAALNPEAAESLRIVYGGSVKPSNAAQLLDMQDIDGGLIGKCALNIEDFIAICRAASTICDSSAQ